MVLYVLKIYVNDMSDCMCPSAACWRVFTRFDSSVCINAGVFTSMHFSFSGHFSFVYFAVPDRAAVPIFSLSSRACGKGF